MVLYKSVYNLLLLLLLTHTPHKPVASHVKRRTAECIHVTSNVAAGKVLYSFQRRQIDKHGFHIS